MIKAIETRYAGCRFRSRLEARWAVFFDALGLKWEYEPEGFELPDGSRYLPDFWLHGVDTNGTSWSYWCEVKPAVGSISAEDKRKLELFVGDEGTDDWKCLLLLDGAPEVRTYTDQATGLAFYLWSLRKRPWHIDDVSSPDERVYALQEGYHGYPATAGHPLDDLQRAVYAAKSARFEFGENGAPKRIKGGRRGH